MEAWQLPFRCLLAGKLRPSKGVDPGTIRGAGQKGAVSFGGVGSWEAVTEVVKDGPHPLRLELEPGISP